MDENKVLDENNTLSYLKKVSENYRWWGILSFLLSFITYLLTLSPTVYWGDSGELATVAYTLGIAHPSGYPTYTLIGHLFTYIPFGSIAWRVNLMSAFFASLTVLLLYFICYKLTKSKLASFAASLVLAFSATFWSQAVVAEVYTLNTFFMALNLLILLHWREKQGEKMENSREPREINHNRWLYLFFFTYGLSLTHHLTSIFLLPGFLYLILVKRQNGEEAKMERAESGKAAKTNKLEWNKELFKAKTILICLVLLTIGLLPYLYLPLRSGMNPALDYGNPETLSNFIHLVSGEQFRSYWSISFTGEDFFQVIGWMLKQMHLALIFLVWGFSRFLQKNRQLANSLILTTAIFFLANLSYHLGKDIFHYYLPVLVIFAIVIGWGIKEALEWLEREYSTTQQKIELMKGGLVVFIAITSLAVPLYFFPDDVNKSKDFSAENYAKTLFHNLENNSLLIVTYHGNFYLLKYFQLVENQRPDLKFVSFFDILQKEEYHQFTTYSNGNFVFNSSKTLNVILQHYSNKENRPTYTLTTNQEAFISQKILSVGKCSEETFFVYANKTIYCMTK